MTRDDGARSVSAGQVLSGHFIDSDHLRRAAGLISAMGYSTLTCTPTTGGGCMCTGDGEQQGDRGADFSRPANQRKLGYSGNTVRMDVINKYSYCASPTQMIWTPQSAARRLRARLPSSPGAHRNRRRQRARAERGNPGTGGTAGAAGGEQVGSGRTGGITEGPARAGAAGGGRGRGARGPVGQPARAAASWSLRHLQGGGNPCVAAHSTVRATARGV